MGENINTTNIIAYKKAIAILKREIKEKRKTLYEFANPNSNTIEKINGFCGLKTHIQVHCLVNSRNASDTYTNKQTHLLIITFIPHLGHTKKT